MNHVIHVVILNPTNCKYYVRTNTRLFEFNSFMNVKIIVDNSPAINC